MTTQRATVPRASRAPAPLRRTDARERQRRRNALVSVLLLLAAGFALVDIARGEADDMDPDPRPTRRAAAGTAPSQEGDDRGVVTGRSASAASSFPATGPGTWAYAAGSGAVLGSRGTARRFRVAVEDRTGQDPAAVAAEVDRILGDPRSWIGSGELRLQRVAKGEPAEFTIYLATPGTSRKMCAEGGVHTGGFTSCRLPGRVIINLARWLTSVPGYGAALSEYRAYAINHEAGHQLGHGHEACPGRGRPAPVMQQQTLALKGCTAYGWPYRNGKRYEGRRIP